MRLTRFPLLWLCVALGLCCCSNRQQVPCPVLVPYSKADDASLLTELKANNLPVTRRYLRDYAGLRAQVRVCAGAK